MSAGLRAGLRYGGLAFAIGAVLGPLRELLLAPRLGGIAAALMEAGVFGALLWLAAARTLPAGFTTADRAAMATTALLVVLLAEAALGLAFSATGLAAQRAPRGAAEQTPGLLLLAWLVALPFLRRA
jgi:hypothetical protein